MQDYEGVKDRLSEEREQEKQLGKSLEALRKETKDKIEKTIKARGAEIIATYDQQLSQIDAKLKKTQQQRDKAKNQGIKGRISAETEDLQQEIKELRRQLKAVLKKEGAPAFCGTKLFYTLFRPGTAGEFLGLLIAFLIFFAAIPIGIYLFFLEKRGIPVLIGIYLIDILLFGGLYVFIGNRTNGKHGEVIRFCQDIRKRIRQNKRKIQTVIRGIKSDVNEEGYHLEEYDDELARAQQDRNDVIAKKQSAQNTFETVTKNIITDEIETAARPHLTELEGKLGEVTALRGQLESEEKDMALRISRDYEQFLGKSHMNEKDIQSIRAMLTEQKANSIIDAVAKFDHPEQ